MMFPMAEHDTDINSPAELGRRLLAACRWSDELRKLALEGFRDRFPDASDEELEEMLYQSQLQGERLSQRLRRRQVAIRRNALKAGI